MCVDILNSKIFRVEKKMRFFLVEIIGVKIDFLFQECFLVKGLRYERITTESLIAQIQRFGCRLMPNRWIKIYSEVTQNKDLLNVKILNGL